MKFFVAAAALLAVAVADNAYPAGYKPSYPAASYPAPAYKANYETYVSLNLLNNCIILKTFFYSPGSSAVQLQL